MTVYCKLYNNNTYVFPYYSIPYKATNIKLYTDIMPQMITILNNDCFHKLKEEHFTILSETCITFLEDSPLIINTNLNKLFVIYTAHFDKDLEMYIEYDINFDF